MPRCVLCIFSQYGQGFNVCIQVTNKHSILSEALHIFSMPVLLCITEILYSKWHVSIDQIQQKDAAGLIAWTTLIYANTLKG